MNDAAHAFDMANRRQGRRSGWSTSVDYQLDGEREARGQAINISSQGARLVLRGNQSHLERRVTLQIAGLDIPGKVVWEQGGRNYRVAGICFESLTPAMQDILACC